MGCSLHGEGGNRPGLTPLIITTELASLGNVVIIAMMRSKTFSTALIWLAALALAAQGLGAPDLLDACQCLACACGPLVQEKSCCEDHVARLHVVNCGQSCCQTPSRDCTEAARIPGSCCCVGGAPSVPANLPKNDKTIPERPLLQVPVAVEATAAPPESPSVDLLTDIRHESPPPRILYCVWRI